MPRGMVRMDPCRCLACGICSYVCVSAAITAVEKQDTYEWRYEPGRCTFCARCAERCPGRALTMAPEPPPSYTSRDQLTLETSVPFQACPGCGKPNRNVTEEWLGTAFGLADDAARNSMRLCPDCRRRRTQSALKVAAGGTK